MKTAPDDIARFRLEFRIGGRHVALKPMELDPCFVQTRATVISGTPSVIRSRRVLQRDDPSVGGKRDQIRILASCSGISTSTGRLV